MMRWIVGTSLKSRGLVVALGVGRDGPRASRSSASMPRDVAARVRSADRSRSRPRRSGSRRRRSSSSITVPLEQDLLNGVAFLDVIRSESVPGLSSIELIFEPGTDPGCGPGRW